ncbi:MAG: hypothetical protein IPL37_07430 [Austwickia sp.]|nr:hypothetical protein [Austwickia sp.]
MHRDDAQSLIHLVGLGARSVRGLVQETHMAVHDSVVREMARVFGPAARRIGGLHGAHLSGIYKVVDLGLQAASAAGVAVAALEPPAHRDRARPAPGLRLADVPHTALMLAFVNGMYGDRLASMGHPFAGPLKLRQDGADVSPTPEGLAAAYPAATDRIAVFLHGLMETEDSWRFRAFPQYGDASVSYGSRLAADGGFTPLWVRYNTGRAVADNGRAFTDLMDAVLAGWPVPIRDIVLVGHSMGGLVLHSALAQAHGGWPEWVHSTVTLGTPYLGAPLERGAKALAEAVEPLAAVRWLKGTIDGRSIGIRDLGEGLGAHQELYAEGAGPSPHCRHYLLFGALLPGERGRWRDFAGDVLVPIPSASGGYDVARLPEGGVATVVSIPRVHHLALLNHPAVYERLAQWFVPQPTD